MMKTKAAVILIVACSVIFGVLGAAGGGEYVMRRMDAIEADRAARQAEIEKRRAEVAQMNDAATKGILDQLFSCQANFRESTVLYEPAPGLQLSLGLRGLGLSPSANQTPRWVIPARIKPLILAGTQGAVYYYMTADNRMDGPYIPQIAPGGQQ